MKKDCLRLFPVLISALSFTLGASGCHSMLSDSIVVNLNKAPGTKISIKQIYKKIEIVPLDNVEGDFSSSLSTLSVTKDRFYLKSGDSMIVSYTHNGRFVDSLHPGSVVTDYYIFKDSVLDLLAGKEFLSFSLPDYTLQQRIPLVTQVALTKIAREDENVVCFSGYKDVNDYTCKYYCDKQYLSEAPGSTTSTNIKRIEEEVHYFSYCDHLFKLFPHSGCIWECGDFTYQFFNPTFRLKNGRVKFCSAQITDSKIYYQLLLGNKEHILILNRADRSVSMLLNGEERELIFLEAEKKYLLLNKCREGVYLPLGVMRDGINYFCCPAADLPRYLTNDLLDSKNATTMDIAQKNNDYVVIKYYL